MDYVFDFLLICHLLALAVAAATTVALPVVMRRIAATAENRPSLGAIAGQLSLNSRIGLGVLVVTGVLMIWVRYGGVDGLNVWFTVKMALVVLMILVLIATAVARGRINPQLSGWITRLTLVGIVISAVLAFN